MNLSSKSSITVAGRKATISALAAIALIPAGVAFADQWHKDLAKGREGINLPAALQYLKQQGLQPKSKVVVGIVDSGLDTLCRDIKPSLWVNPEETDRSLPDNGYPGDLHGWNFLGTRDGSFNMTSAGTEEYREFKRLYPKYKNITPQAVTDTAEYSYYLRMRRKAGIDSYLKFYAFNLEKDKCVNRLDSVVKASIPAQVLDTISIGALASRLPDSKQIENDFAAIATDIIKGGSKMPWKTLVGNHRKAFALMKERIASIEGKSDKRLLMGDDLNNAADRFYGNNILQSDGCDHGTFVAGIVAGRGVIDPNVSGIYPEAKLMIIRAIPEGDEYDKDVASSIRYAVDNGAKVVNLSLGKLTSPNPQMVNDAIAYALDKDVLIIQAAGNSHLDLEPINYFPTGRDKDGKRFANFVRVASSNQNGGISPITNYGATKVDLFAPGDDITGNTVNNEFMTSSGTSIAAPVTAAVAAMVRAYYPTLTAPEVKQILIDCCRKYPALTGKAVSGGVIDAENALRLAADREMWKRVNLLTQENLDKVMDGRTPYSNWICGTSSLYYDVKTDNGIKFYLVDAATGKKRLMIKDYEKFIKERNAICGDSAKADRAAVYGINFEKGNTKFFTFKHKGKVLKYDIASGKLALASEKETKKREATGTIRRSYADCDSPDSLYTTLGCGYDLYVRNNKTGVIKRITTDGKEDASHTFRCKSDTTSNNACGSWRGMRYVQVLNDNSSVLRTGLIHSVGNKRPTADVYRMPMPGDSGVKQTRILWHNPLTDETRYLPIEKYKDQVVEVNFYKDQEQMFFTRRSRKGDKTDLCRINLNNGTVDELISETTEPHGNLSLFNYQILGKGDEFLWWSERTGRGNYYLYDRNGKLKNRISQGDSLVAGNIVHVDTVGRAIVFAAYGNEPGVNPYYKYFYRATLDGKKQRLLTPDLGTHELSLSTDHRYAVDKYSRNDMAPRFNVISLGKNPSKYEFERVDISPVTKLGYKCPEMFTVKAADGVTDLYGIMYTPSNLDTTRLYPVITNVYPGPQDDQVPRGFVLDDNYNQSLAEMGFIVINSSSRGSSPLRGNKFYTYGYGNMRDYPLADDKHTIETLAKRYLFMDLNRVGIYGHSGGGFQTAAAILTYPDFYKVGLAASGNHDNNIYIQNWGEAFHGIDEVTDPKTGKTEFKTSIPTSMEIVQNLKGRLMLVHGDIDKNVSPSHTLRLADALINKGKYFDMLLMPNKDHGLNSVYYTNLIRKYFFENLMRPNFRVSLPTPRKD